MTVSKALRLLGDVEDELRGFSRNNNPELIIAFKPKRRAKSTSRSSCPDMPAEVWDEFLSKERTWRLVTVSSLEMSFYRTR